jgi:hypothetical protein
MTRSFSFRQSVSLPAGAVISLLAFVLLAPPAVQAGCSHLVVSASDRFLHDNQLDALITGGSSSSIADDLAQDPLKEQGPKRPTPCSGPGCSSRVPLPVSTASQVLDGSDQWVALSAVVRLAVASPPCRTVDEPAARPAGRKPSIFHPPPA